MGFGPVALSDVQVADVVAPNVPQFLAIAQLSNKEIKCTVILPSNDSNGDALSGLVKLTIATSAMLDGVNPFEGMTMDQILAMTSTQVVETTVTPDQAGTQIDVVLPVVVVGSFQAFAAACGD